MAHTVQMPGALVVSTELIVQQGQRLDREKQLAAVTVDLFIITGHCQSYTGMIC